MKFIESEYIIFGDLYRTYKPAHTPDSLIIYHLGYSSEQYTLLYDLRRVCVISVVYAL